MAPSGKAVTSIYRANSPQDIQLIPTDSWEMHPLTQNPHTGMHDFTSYFDRIIQTTQAEVERVTKEAKQSNVKPYRIPVFVRLPAQYHELEASTDVKKKLGLTAKDPFTMGTLASRFFHSQIAKTIPNYETSVLPLAAAFEYRTEDTDHEPTAAMEDEMLAPLEFQATAEVINLLGEYMGIQAKETVEEILKRHRNDPESMKYYHVIHWGSKDRPLYRIIAKTPELLDIYTGTIKKSLRLKQDLRVSFPHQPITDTVDQILKKEIGMSIHEANGTSPIVINNKPKTVDSQVYKYPAISASIRDGNYRVDVHRLNDSGEMECDQNASWQMTPGNLMKFSEEFSRTIVDATAKFKDENKDVTNYRIPVYVDWPPGIKLTDSILPNLEPLGVLNEVLDCDALLYACFKTTEEKLKSLGHDRAVLFNKDPGLTQNSEERSLSNSLIKSGEIPVEQLQRITQDHFKQASKDNKRSLRFLVRLARLLAIVAAETALERNLDHNKHSQVLTFGQKADKDWLAGMLDFPEVRTAIAQEFIRVLKLPYTPDEIVINLGGEAVTKPEDIVINQAKKQIDNLNGRTQESSNKAIEQLDAIYNEDPLEERTPSPNLLRNSPKPSSENDIPYFYGVSISGFTGKLSYTKLAGRSEEGIQEIDGGFVKQQDKDNTKAELDSIAIDLAKLAKQQLADKTRLGYTNYKIPLAIGWPCDSDQDHLLQELSSEINSKLLSRLNHKATKNSAIVGLYLFGKMTQQGIQNPFDHFNLQPRSFLSIEDGGLKREREKQADIQFKQFHPRIKEGWVQYNMGNIEEARTIFREVTEKCADLYVLQLNLKEISPGYAKFGSTFDNKTLRLFEFLRIFGLRRVFEKIVEREINQPNYRFRLKLNQLDRKGPQYSDPVKAHMAETMHGIGYTNDVFELPGPVQTQETI